MNALKKWVPIWVLPVLVVFAVGTVWLRLSAVQTTYEINQLGKQIQTKKKELDQLDFDLAVLRSPRHLEELAKTKFTLRSPKSFQVIRLKAGDR